MEDDVWDENRYKNWVRGAKGLEFLQEGLTYFVGDKAPICRDQLLRNILAVPVGPLPQCNQCTSENLLPEHANSKKACGRTTTCIQKHARNCFGSRNVGRRTCPSGICSKLYDAIVLDHPHRDPLWKNTDPTTWCSDPKGWSFVKCFETIPGPGTSAQDTDAAGLLSILLNNISMQNWLACQNMGSDAACPFYKARNIRNEILHNAKMELDDQTLDGYLDTFVTVLEDPKCLKTHLGSPESVKKLTELKSKQIHISLRDEKRILKLRKEALSELDETKQEALQEIDDMISSGVQKIKDEASIGLSVAEKAKTEAVQKIQDETSIGLSAAEKVKTEAVQKIQYETSIGLSAAEKAKTESVQKIKDETSTGLSAAEKIKTEAVQKIKDETSIGLSAAEKAKTEAVQKIKDETSIGLSEVEKAKTEAVQKIEDETNIGLSATEKGKMDAVQKIKDETSIGLSTAVQKIKDETSIGLSTAVQKIKDETSIGLSTAVQKIKDETSIGLSTAVQKMKDETSIGLSTAVQKIKDETSTGLSTAVQKIKDETSTGLSTAVQKIKDETSTGLSTAMRKLSDNERKTVSEVSAAGSEAVAIIYDRQEAILSTSEGAKSNMLEELKRQKDLTRTTDGKVQVTSPETQSS